VSVNTPDVSNVYTCIDVPKTDALLDRALCGCVEGNCSWFAVDRQR